MTKQYPTKQYLSEVISNREFAESVPPEIVIVMARQLLASMEQEPVGEVIEQNSGVMMDGLVISEKATYRNIKGIHKMKMMPLGTKFYAAPQLPQPAVGELTAETLPDEIKQMPAATAFVWMDGWNKACRAAMLKGNHRDLSYPVDPQVAEYEKIMEQSVPDGCWCLTCRPVTMTDMRFVVCPDCGNKRCPHANDHGNACTGSNEPGQEGSAYPAAPQQEASNRIKEERIKIQEEMAMGARLTKHRFKVK